MNLETRLKNYSEKWRKRETEAREVLRAKGEKPSLVRAIRLVLSLCWKLPRAQWSLTKHAVISAYKGHQFKQRREAERLDRIRNPDSYKGR